MNQCNKEHYPICCWTHYKLSLKKKSSLYKEIDHKLYKKCRKCRKWHKVDKVYRAKFEKKHHRTIKINDIVILPDINERESVEEESKDDKVDKLNQIQKANNKSISKSDESQTLHEPLIIVSHHQEKNKSNKPKRVLKRRFDKVEVKTDYKLSEYQIMSPLGQGGFATVFQCRDPSGNKWAMKKIESKSNRGIPCLMEASIMSTYQHPNLTRAVISGSRPDGLYIVQELALCDLHRWRSETKPTREMLRLIVNQIVQGIAFLHDKNIIHGDVKASNVLVYDTNPIQVKVSDFNLSSLKQWNSALNVCTATHRPIEVWLGEKWDEKIDIWSLGCTLHELYYGRGLIPYQGKSEDPRTREKYINSILEWQIKGHGKGKSDNKYSLLLKYNVIYEPPRIMETANSSSPYFKLMYSMLKVDMQDRPTIHEIATNSYFFGLRPTQGEELKKIESIHPAVVSMTNLTSFNEEYNLSQWSSIVLTSRNPEIQETITSSLKNKLRQEMTFYTDDNDVLELATDICCRYLIKTNDINSTIKLTCTWMARKLIRKASYDIKVPVEHKNSKLRDAIMKCERMICKELKFQLH